MQRKTQPKAGPPATKHRRKTAKSQASRKTKHHTGWLVPDVPVRTASKEGQYSYEVVIAPPKITRSRDLVRWLANDCAGWLHTLTTLATCRADNDLIESVAYNVHSIVTQVAKCLRAGTMPLLKDVADGSDPLPYLAAARKIQDDPDRSDNGEEVNQLLAVAERIVRPLHAKSEAQQKEEREKNPWLTPRQKSEAAQKEKRIRTEYVDAKLKQLRAKREDLLERVSETIAADLDQEIEALEEEKDKGFRKLLDGVIGGLEAAHSSPEAKKEDRAIMAEAKRRLAKESHAPASPA